MSMRPTDHPILPSIEHYYAERLARFGATPRGVDWNSDDSQALRFDRLLEIVDRRTGDAASILDVGCGYGALLTHLRARGFAHAYTGFDISPSMIEAARATHAAAAGGVFTSDASAVRPASYVVASGIFNVKLHHTTDVWRAYVMEVLAQMRGWATRGFAFNMLSTSSDPARRRPDLHYVDPCEMFDICRQTFSPRVSLLHDYPLFEFTILVRM